MKNFFRIITVRSFMFLGILMLVSSLCDFLFKTDITNKLTAFSLFIGFMLGNALALLIEQRKNI
ncbi:hypothetical protein DOK67_0002990 [Enterococcus sp. DIV0212c]